MRDFPPFPLPSVQTTYMRIVPKENLARCEATLKSLKKHNFDLGVRDVNLSMNAENMTAEIKQLRFYEAKIKGTLKNRECRKCFNASTFVQLLPEELICSDCKGGTGDSDCEIID